VIDKFSPRWGHAPPGAEKILEAAESAVNQIYADLSSSQVLRPAELTNIRDLRSKHLGKFVMVKTVRRASEIRPEIMATFWNAWTAGIIRSLEGAFVSRPWQCSCGKKDFKQVESEKIDTRG